MGSRGEREPRDGREPHVFSPWYPVRLRLTHLLPYPAASAPQGPASHIRHSLYPPPRPGPVQTRSSLPCSRLQRASTLSPSSRHWPSARV
ncbi:hypothetical protein L226DRAFT_530305 [Lentinus tigrinus ALCF2SS1-7]|uniref:uncharacterized protein n=1 Tax=Lentinus tigrinus ALCF2SS1-7 TaxID=1328758 RepID=UPI001165FA61|nr:hypothetical protein L226DRAFT_530305 [Lentinus tigrinus ALCF2SS1-7]